MGLVLIILLTIVTFLFFSQRFLFKNLSKFYLVESKRIIKSFRIEENNFGDLILTFIVSICIGVLTFFVYKTLIVIVAYFFSSDLIDFFIKTRGVFATSHMELQNPYLVKNIISGLFLTTFVQFFSIFFMVKSMQYFMKSINIKYNSMIYNSSNLVFFSTISCCIFLIIELFAYSQSITFINTFTNIVLLIGAKMGYVLFFLSILHIEMVRNGDYKNALFKELSFNKIEKNLISNKKGLLLTVIIIAIFLNIPQYTGFQFGEKNWLVLLKLIIASGLFYFILMKAFAKGFDYIGVYMIDDNRNQDICNLRFVNGRFRRFVITGLIVLSLILIIVNFRSFIFFSFYAILVTSVTIFIFILGYAIGSLISKSNYDGNTLKNIAFSFGKVLLPGVLMILFALTLLSAQPKKISIENYGDYQRNIVDENGNQLYLERSKINNPSAPIGYNDIPAFFIKALVSKEDRGFFNQNSWFFNKRNWHGISSTGRSNINQQLIKNLAFEISFPQELQRKFSEFITSYQLSIQYSPEYILTQYINNVSFNGGVGHTGIVNGCYDAFGRNLNELNHLEQLYILFTLQRKSTFKISSTKYVTYKQVYKYPKQIKKRLLIIAKNWHKNGLLTKREFRRLKNKQLNFRIPFDSEGKHTRFKTNTFTTTRLFLSKNLPKNNNDISYETSITKTNQSKLKLGLDRFNNKFRNYLHKNGCNLYSSALVVDISNGEILAHYGGEGVTDLTQFGEGFPMASLIKPFVLLELLETGHKIELYDGKLKGRKTPKNGTHPYSNKYVGEKYIIKKSPNAPLTNIDEITNPINLFKNIEKKFKQLNISPDNAINLSDKRKTQENRMNYPIGSRRMTLYNITQVFQTLLNGGRYVKLSAFRKSFDPYKLEYSILSKDSYSIYNEVNVDKIKSAMKLVTEQGGTAHNLKKYLPKDIEFICKTGTSSGSKHGYTILSDGNTLIATWISYGKLKGNKIDFETNTKIPLNYGGHSAGVLAAFIYDAFYN